MRENLLIIFLLAVALAGAGCAAPLVGHAVEERHKKKEEEKKKEAQEQEAAKKATTPEASADKKLIDGKWYKKGLIEEPAGSGKYKEMWLPE
ncbi:MAG TPA: hypothetical protein ACFYED_09195 [Candidatus Tripitaka californicus]|uniref:hypothetical protein n=1 Tax=Candidatus Tripitaka californicus TaxID=3367616 RepID=UPI004026083E|nr:hypothetical protein [Planctomycetota bacterium]